MLLALLFPYLNGGISIQLLPLFWGINTVQQSLYIQTQTIRDEKSTGLRFSLFFQKFSYCTIKTILRYYW